MSWDVTDFGSGQLNQIGRTIFTLRNGKFEYPGFDKRYAEKVMFLLQGQRSIIHCHKQKQEDIICQAGSGVMIRLWQVAHDDGLSNESLTLAIDGIKRIVKAGEVMKLLPGQSIYVPPKTYHQFWGCEDKKNTLSIEVSSTCDDWHDNFFLDQAGERFPEIHEDVVAKWLLCSEYRKQNNRPE